MWWQSCFEDSRAPPASEKWYHRTSKPVQGGGRFYGGTPKNPATSHNTSSTNTISVNRHNSYLNDNDAISAGDKKPCAFYNERSLTKELEMTEDREQELILLRNENKQLRELVRELTPLREKYNKLRGLYLKKEKDLQRLEARVASLEYNSR